MIDWSACPLVISRPGYVSGAPALRDDPRVPAETVVVNMDAGETAEDVIENFGLHTRLEDVLAIYDYAKRVRGSRPAR